MTIALSFLGAKLQQLLIIADYTSHLVLKVVLMKSGITIILLATGNNQQ